MHSVLQMGTSSAALGHFFFLLSALLLFNLCEAHPPQYTNYSFPTFTPDDLQTYFFRSYNAGGIVDGALQITPDTANDLSYLVNRSGRMLIKDPINLWQSSKSNSKRIASFNTSFTVNVYRRSSSSTAVGKGIAFLIAPSLGEPPANSYGQYLGLTNSTLDGNPSNRIVAVELDPDDNRVGLVINSVRSNTTAPLSPLGIEIGPPNGSDNYVWIDYDGSRKYIWVYMSSLNRPKPSAPVLKAPLDLSEHVNSRSYFGFAASTGTELELNCVKAWNLSVEQLPNSGHGAWILALAIALPLATAIAVAGGVSWYCVARRRNGGVDPSVLAGTLRSLPGTTREFEFKVLKKATNNFDERLKLGDGGFGIVYKGVIPGENTEVAVKKFSRGNMKGQGDFLAELSIINRLRHKHLVRLLGWCHKNGMLLLVYEYMPNGSLDQHLFCEQGRPVLTFDHRYNILTGVASALHYLHNEYDQRVVHRDLKASNILLESNFNARLGDFGLARALDTDRTSYIDVELGGVAGTMGYIAPECFHTGKATAESDVFGFGAVVLEVVCGRRPRCDISGFQFLADWVWKLHREDRILDAVDSMLDGQFAREDAVRLLLLGLACTHPLPKERPKAAAIVQIISRSAAPPVVPRFKPAFVWPSGPVDDESCTDSMTSTLVSSQFYASSAGWTPRAIDSFPN